MRLSKNMIDGTRVALCGGAVLSVSLLAAMLVVGSASAQETTTAASSNASSGGACIPQSAQDNVNRCPGSSPAATKRAAAQQGQSTRPTSRLRTAAPVKQETKQGPTGPSVQIDASTARGRERRQARARTLLEREVQLLNRLVGNTRRNNPRRPEVLLRLAETYFELQQSLNAEVRGQDEPIFEACEQQKNRSRCQQARQAQRQAQEGLNNARQESIRTYATLVQDHPDFDRMDEVLFSLAFGLEELRQHDRARQVYRRLIKGFPQSRFIPHAYLSFAEFYFAEGDMSASLQFYDKVVEFPPERNPVYGYALYKSAWAHYNVEDYRGALESFVATIEFAVAHPDATDAGNLARQSRKELVLPYSQVGTPARALDFFRRFAQDNDQALGMLENLGELYFDTGQWENTITVYHKLMSEQPSSDKLCYWQSRVTNAVISSSPKREQLVELRRMIDVYETFIGQNRPAEAANECKAASAQVLVWLATAWHREAIGTESQPGTNDQSTMDLAARLYRILIAKFPDMEDLEFPDIAREDWPTQYKVAYYYAELLWKMEDWAQCGPAFDKVVEINPQGEFTNDAAYAAVLCYNNLYQQQYAGREREVARDEERQGRRRGRRGRAEPEPTPEEQYGRRDLTELETGMLNAFTRFVCYVPDSDDIPQIKYRRARIYYEAHHYEEAALIFKDIAWNHRDSEMAEFAANLYLDSLNTIGTRREPNRPECLDDIEDAIEPLSSNYCATQQAQDAHPDLCGVLSQLRCDVLRKKAEAYENTDQHKEAAATYVRIFRRYRECGRLDEVLYNAAINFEAARLLGRAIQVRKVLIERFSDSEWAKRAVYLVGANYHALAFYEQAATYYEQFARDYPGEDGESCSEAERTAGTCAIAHDALQNAVFFRIGLGNTAEAESDAELFTRNYKRKLPRQTSQVVYSIGTIYEREENWQRVILHYRRYLRDFRRTALPHQIIRANVLMGRGYWETDRKDDAKRPFRTAVSAWARTPNAINGLSDTSEVEKILYIKEGLDSTAEALFYLAEYKFAEFRQVRFPRYRGGRSMDRVNRWAQNEFREWIGEKMTALRAAEAEYNKIAELSVTVREGVPPLQSPAWMIASAARVGQMYRQFVDDFRDAPVPEEIENDPELFDIYVGALDEQSEPLQRQAIDKFEFCLTTATNVRWFNEWSRTCESELNRLNPRQYPLAAELRGSATFVRGTWGRPGAVELTTEGDEEEEGGAQ